MSVPKVEMIDIDSFSDPRGHLFVIEGNHFYIARAFWVTDQHSWRGEHYHLECSQILIPILGTFWIVTSDPDGLNRQEFIVNFLDGQGLFVPPGNCISYTPIDDGGALLVLADRPFDDDVTIPCGGEQ